MDRRNELIKMISDLDTEIKSLNDKVGTPMTGGSFEMLIIGLTSFRRTKHNLERELQSLDLEEEIDKTSIKIERFTREFSVDAGIFISCALVAALGIAFIFLI